MFCDRDASLSLNAVVNTFKIQSFRSFCSVKCSKSLFWSFWVWAASHRHFSHQVQYSVYILHSSFFNFLMIFCVHRSTVNKNRIELYEFHLVSPRPSLLRSSTNAVKQKWEKMKTLCGSRGAFNSLSSIEHSQYAKYIAFVLLYFVHQTQTEQCDKVKMTKYVRFEFWF